MHPGSQIAASSGSASDALALVLVHLGSLVPTIGGLALLAEQKRGRWLVVSDRASATCGLVRRARDGPLLEPVPGAVASPGGGDFGTKLRGSENETSFVEDMCAAVTELEHRHSLIGVAGGTHRRQAIDVKSAGRRAVTRDARCDPNEVRLRLRLGS